MCTLIHTYFCLDVEFCHVFLVPRESGKAESTSETEMLRRLESFMPFLHKHSMRYVAIAW